MPDSRFSIPILSKYQDYILTLFSSTTLEKANSEDLGALSEDSSSSYTNLHTTTHTAAQKVFYSHCIISQLTSEVTSKIALNLFRFSTILSYSNVLTVEEKVRGGSDRKMFCVLFPEEVKLQNELIGHSKKARTHIFLCVCTEHRRIMRNASCHSTFMVVSIPREVPRFFVTGGKQTLT